MLTANLGSSIAPAQTDEYRPLIGGGSFAYVHANAPYSGVVFLLLIAPVRNRPGSAVVRHEPQTPCCVPETKAAIWRAELKRLRISLIV